MPLGGDKTADFAWIRALYEFGQTAAYGADPLRVRQDILVAAVEHGLRLTALRPVVPSLDDIYRTAVERPTVKAPGLKRKSIARTGSRRRPE